MSIYPLAYSVSVLKFKNKELALYIRNDHSQNFKEMLEETRSNRLEFIWDVTKSPKSFDKVVLGNSFTGNHYVVGYTPYGYNYIELSLNKQTTKFKAKNTHNGDGVHILHESKDTVILTDYEKLYRVTLKP
ncbi:hypothetical protein [Flavobacterium sp. ASW18X]|uniref:hypothetical protein n=1 Tax=Flavobacterium sp. ASW18X TaxID=2572595 RepID=UPI0010AE8BE6|nr:hypothetical protein [Flavobacterium sp. ASW18X]TKD63507.1 hypothetical protein FBT53_07985 [Flavobacterium sp. ASW18X]